MKVKKITRSARGEDCSLRIVGVCNFATDTTVYAHAPCVDKGMGFKSPDWWGMYACSNCHDAIDSRTNIRELTIENKLHTILSAVYETQKKLFKKGLIKV